MIVDKHFILHSFSIVLAGVYIALMFPENEIGSSKRATPSADAWVAVILASALLSAVTLLLTRNHHAKYLTVLIFYLLATASTVWNATAAVPIRSVVAQSQLVHVFFMTMWRSLCQTVEIQKGDADDRTPPTTPVAAEMSPWSPVTPDPLRTKKRVAPPEGSSSDARWIWVLAPLLSPSLGTILFCVLDHSQSIRTREYCGLVFWFLPPTLHMASALLFQCGARSEKTCDKGSRNDSTDHQTEVVGDSFLAQNSLGTSSSTIPVFPETPPRDFSGGENRRVSSPTGELNNLENSAFFFSFLNSLRVPFFVVNTKSGLVQYWSPALEEATSLLATMVVRRPVQYVFEQLHPSDYQPHDAQQCVQPSLVQSEFDLRLPNGTSLPMIVYPGRICRCVGAHPCIVMLRMLSLPGCITNINTGAIVLSNIALARLFQISLPQCIGCQLAELCRENDVNPLTTLEVPPYVLSLFTVHKVSRNVNFAGSFIQPMSPKQTMESLMVMDSLRELVTQHRTERSEDGEGSQEKILEASQKFFASVADIIENTGPEKPLSVSPGHARAAMSFAVPLTSHQSIVTSAPPWAQLQSQDTNVLPHIAICTFPDEEFKVGRGAKCHVQLHDPFVSAIQFSITRTSLGENTEKYRVTLKDYSANGTFINVRMVGQKNKTELYPGDQITFRLTGTQKFFAGYVFVVNTCIVERPSLARTGKADQHSHHSPTAHKKLKWKIGEELLGKGGNAEVFLGINTNNGKLIAVKRVPLKHSDEASMRKYMALQEEIDVLKDFVHPNIVQYLSTDQDETHFHLLLEFVPGGSIRHLLNNFGSLSEQVIVKYSVQIIEGLKYLHGRRVIHGDLKTANVLVTDKGEVKITDFGTAKVLAHEGPVAGKTIAGTLLWMAPELFRGMSGTHACDVWSFGCCLLEMMTAKGPWDEYNFENESQIMTLLENTTEPPEIPEGFSHELRSLTKDCLSLQPQGRPSCEQILWRLLNLPKPSSATIETKE